MIIKLIIMMLVGIIFGICVTVLAYLVYTDYQDAKEDEEFDNALRDMEQFYIAEYYNNKEDLK